MTVSRITAHAREKRQKLLHEAVKQGNVAQIKSLISQGANPSEASAGEMGCKLSPIMVAIAMRSAPAIELLLPLSDLSIRDEFGRTALCYALMYLASVKKLDEAGLALLRALAPSGGKLLDNNGRMPLSEAAAYWRGSDEVFEAVVAELAASVDLNQRDLDGLTAVGHALRAHGSSQIAMILWRASPDKKRAAEEQSLRDGGLAHIAAETNRADFLDEIASLVDFQEPDSRGRTPLMRAAASGAMDCVEFLAKKGAQAVDHDGCDALMLSIESFIKADPSRRKSQDFCEAKASEFFKNLAGGADLFARDFLGESAIDKARDRSLWWLAKDLEAAKEGRSPLAENASKQSGGRGGQAKLQELLHQAASLGDVALVEKRLAQGADPLLSSGELGQTALMAAAASGSLGAIEKLAPASSLLAVDCNGKTALMTFMESLAQRAIENQFECVAKLVSPEAARQACLRGRTPLMAAVRLGKDFAKWIEIMGPMSDWMARDNSGETVASQAFGDRRWAVAGRAVWHAHPDQAWLAASANGQGEGLAHLAARIGYVEMLEDLKGRADFDARNAKGRTPLMAACVEAQMFHRGLAAKMLAPWSDGSAVDNEGCDALMLAIESSRGALDDEAILDVVKALAPRSNLSAIDCCGESALSKAESRGLEQCSVIIRERMAILAEREALADATEAAMRAGSRPLRI